MILSGGMAGIYQLICRGNVTAARPQIVRKNVFYPLLAWMNADAARASKACARKLAINNE